MGSGKTTLIKELVKQLGAGDTANSPTFAIVNEYKGEKNKIYHFDLYRLNDFYEALDFGIEEYLDAKDAYVFIEWPDIIDDIIPENSQKIRIIVKENEARELQIL
jgi:tRNA threonylcarbamoyladenosine biosynthesis protein TsaE